MQFRGNGTMSLSMENRENLCVNSTLSSNWQKQERKMNSSRRKNGWNGVHCTVINIESVSSLSF